MPRLKTNNLPNQEATVSEQRGAEVYRAFYESCEAMEQQPDCRVLLDCRALHIDSPERRELRLFVGEYTAKTKRWMSKNRREVDDFVVHDYIYSADDFVVAMTDGVTSDRLLVEAVYGRHVMHKAESAVPNGGYNPDNENLAITARDEKGRHHTFIFDRQGRDGWVELMHDDLTHKSIGWILSDKESMNIRVNDVVPGPSGSSLIPESPGIATAPN